MTCPCGDSLGGVADAGAGSQIAEDIMSKDRHRLRREIEEMDRPPEDHTEKERNSSVAIAVLAVVVVLLLLAIVMGTTDAFRP